MENHNIYKKLNSNLQNRVYLCLFKDVKPNYKLVVNQLNKFFYCMKQWTPPIMETNTFYQYYGYIKLLCLVNMYCPEVKKKNIVRYWTKFVIWQHEVMLNKRLLDY